MYPPLPRESGAALERPVRDYEAMWVDGKFRRSQPLADHQLNTWSDGGVMRPRARRIHARASV